METARVTPEKPRIKKLSDTKYYYCWAHDSHNRERGEPGSTPQEAYANFKRLLRALESLGLRWEIFP